MDQLNYIVQWIAKDIFGVPAYLVGLMTLIALVASRKSTGEVIGGALKATLGFIILGIGAGAVIGALTPLGALITGAFGVNGVVPTNEAITAIANKDPNVAQNVALAMFLGVLGSLVLARLTPLRYVFLTGHHMLFMATVLTVVLFAYGVTVNLPPWDFGRLLGVYVALFFLVAQLINWLAFGVTPGPRILAGGLLIIAGAMVITFWEPR